MRGIYKMHGAIQTSEAWKDWSKLAGEVVEAGYPMLVIQFRPQANSGWRRIDKAIVMLRTAFKEVQNDQP